MLQKSAARKPPRENAPRRAKVRRDQRRASRSARCFALDDGENLVWVMSQKQIERRREVAAALAEAAVQYDVKRAMALLRREPTVPSAPPRPLQAYASLPHPPSPMPSPSLRCAEPFLARGPPPIPSILTPLSFSPPPLLPPLFSPPSPLTIPLTPHLLS